MRMWQVVLLVNLALTVGLGLGYASWGRRLEKLEQELEAAGARVERLERELEARAGGGRAGERQWQVRGVVRAIFPEGDVVVITHEEIRGLMPAMTMGVRTASPRIRDSVRVGDTIRFTLRGTGRNVAIVAIEKSE